MALARGYGMSATFMLAAFFVYKNKEQFKSYYIWVAFLFILAVYASYVAIVPFGIMMIYMFVLDFNFKIPEVPIKTKRWIIGLSGLALYGFYSVTKAGKPLYGAYTQTFFEAIPQDVLNRFFNTNEISLQIVTAVTIFIAITILVFAFIYRNQNPIGVVTVVSFLAIFTVAWIGGKPLPTGRVLVPYWPLFVFSIIEIIEILFQKIRLPKIAIRTLNVILLGFLIQNFSTQTHLKKHLTSETQQWKKPINIMAGYGKEIYPHDSYYLEKNWQHDIIPNQLKVINPDNTIQLALVTFNVYDDLRLITLNFNEPTDGLKLKRTVLSKGEITYTDEISFDSEIYNMEDNKPMLLPYPRFGGEVLIIEKLDGSWSQQFEIPEGTENFFPIEIRHAI
jgi:hypothetical protein